MPILASGIASFIAWFVGYFSTRIGIKTSMAIAIFTVLTVSYGIGKAALFGVAAALDAVEMPALVNAFWYAFPHNALVCFQASVLSQTILEAYRVWRLNFWGSIQAMGSF